MKAAKSNRPLSTRGIFFVALLAFILAVLFGKSFLPGYVFFSNDGPLGQQKTAWVQLPAAFLGGWGDVSGIGGNAGSSPADLTGLIRWTGSARVCQFLRAGRAAHSWFGGLDVFPSITTGAFGGHSGRAGSRLEFHLFCLRLLGGGLPTDCHWHGLLRAGSGGVQLAGNPAAHPLDATGPGRAGRRGQRDGSRGHWRDFQPVRRGFCFVQGPLGIWQSGIVEIGTRRWTGGRHRPLCRVHRDPNRRVPGGFPNRRHRGHDAGRGSQGAALELGHPMERTQGGNAQPGRAGFVWLPHRYAQHDDFFG